MGFLLASVGVGALFVSLVIFLQFYGDDWTGLYEAITGFGLGGSAIALFGRVGGGIYTKVTLHALVLLSEIISAVRKLVSCQQVPRVLESHCRWS